MMKIMEDARVLSQEKVAFQTHLLRLSAGRISREARLGQFLMLQVRDGTDPLLRRPFSFHRIDGEQGIIEILYRVVGRGTWCLSRCERGDHVGIIGPLGNGFQLPECDPAPVVAVAGGIGIAPMLQLLEKLAQWMGLEGRKRGIHLFYGVRTAEEFIPETALDTLGITVHWSTDDGTKGHEGFVTRLLEDTTRREKIKPCAVYSCGPLAMQYHVAKWALENAVPSQLSLESLMACGIGACLGCALPAVNRAAPQEDHYLHVCKDGPVFKAEMIQWHKIQTHPANPPIFLYS